MGGYFLLRQSKSRKLQCGDWEYLALLEVVDRSCADRGIWYIISNLRGMASLCFSCSDSMLCVLGDITSIDEIRKKILCLVLFLHSIIVWCFKFPIVTRKAEFLCFEIISFTFLFVSFYISRLHIRPVFNLWDEAWWYLINWSQFSKEKEKDKEDLFVKHNIKKIGIGRHGTPKKASSLGMVPPCNKKKGNGTPYEVCWIKLYGEFKWLKLKRVKKDDEYFVLFTHIKIFINVLILVSFLRTYTVLRIEPMYLFYI